MDTEHSAITEPVRRIEIFTGAGRRRTWSAEDKARIVAESLTSGKFGLRRGATRRAVAAVVVRLAPASAAQWIFEEFRITIAKKTLSRELRAMGYCKLSARPRHYAQAEGAMEDFKKASPRAWRQLRARKASMHQGRNLVQRRGSYRPEEQDHPPLGQARHPPERTPRSTHRFHLHLRRGLPSAGQGRDPDPASLQHGGDEPTPRGDRRDGRAHAVLLVDQAGWHLSARLVVPANITILALPPKCPELNQVENVWQFMRANWLSNRVFKSYDDLVDHCCQA